MTTQDHIDAISKETKALVEGLIDEMSNFIEEWKAKGESFTEEKKAQLLAKKAELHKQYETYKNALKDKANDSKDELVEKIGELQKKLDAVGIK